MTAPALPGAAPDPARLPPEVEEALSLALSDAPARGTCDELLLRTAIARALGGDGEPVAWGVANGKSAIVAADTDRTFVEETVHYCESDEPGMGPHTVVPLYTRPAATGDTGEGERTLPTRGDVGRPEATRDPVFILQYRDKGRRPDSDRWRPVGVWFTREEAETFAAAHAHRWPDDRHGKRWQVYCVPADGEMARLLKAVTLRAVATPQRQEAPMPGDTKKCDYQGREFGAPYLDSVCIDGWLWDADSGDMDENGEWVFDHGGPDVGLNCPKCNPHAHDEEVDDAR